MDLYRVELEHKDQLLKAALGRIVEAKKIIANRDTAIDEHLQVYTLNTYLITQLEAEGAGQKKRIKELEKSIRRHNTNWAIYGGGTIALVIGAIILSR